MCAFNLILSYPFDVRADCGEYKLVGMKCLTTCTADDKVSVETVLQTFPNFLHYVQVQVFGLHVHSCVVRILHGW